MKVVVHGVHITLSPELKQHVQEQLADPLERLFRSDATELDVHLVDTNGHKGGLDKECRVTLHVPGQPTLHVTERSEDLFKSVSLVSDRLNHAAKRHLQRRHDHDHDVGERLQG